MKRIFTAFTVVFLSLACYAQIGINTETPNKHTALDIQNLTDSDGNLINGRGVSIPSMTTQQRNEQIGSGTDVPDGLLIYNIDEQCYNVFSAASLTWESICGKSGTTGAITIQDCSGITVNGKYVIGKPVNEDNMLVIPLNITSAGKFIITAYAYSNDNTYNGYFFYMEGEFPYEGDLTLSLPAFGTPLKQANINEPDTIKVYVNNELLCSVTNNVIDPDGQYFNFDCSSTVVEGTFLTGIDQSTLPNSIIKCYIEADELSNGTPYEIFTDTINGLYFYGSGFLQTGTNEITLHSLGIPTKSGDYLFTLQSNLSYGDGSPIMCGVPLKVTARTINILMVAAYDYVFSGTNAYGTGAFRLLQNADLFGAGQTAVFPVNGFQFSSLTASRDANLQQTINSFQPDIIFLMHDYVPTIASINILNNFINQNGVIIHTSDYSTNVLQMVNAVFNTNMPASSYNNSGDGATLFPVEKTNTTITKGPFAEIEGMYLQRDATGNNEFLASGLGSNATVIAYRQANDTTWARCFIHNSKGYMYYGDGGPFTSSAVSETGTPLKVNGSYPTLFYNSVGGQMQCQSHFFLNTMAWAINYVIEKRLTGNETFNIE